MALRRPPQLLSALAWLNVVLHAVGLLFAVWGMRPGTQLVELPERLAYLSASPLAWSLGWGIWMLCALALVAFFAALAQRLGKGVRPLDSRGSDPFSAR